MIVIWWICFLAMSVLSIQRKIGSNKGCTWYHRTDCKSIRKPSQTIIIIAIDLQSVLRCQFHPLFETGKYIAKMSEIEFKHIHFTEEYHQPYWIPITNIWQYFYAINVIWVHQYYSQINISHFHILLVFIERNITNQAKLQEAISRVVCLIELVWSIPSPCLPPM